jgi:hypothetical protein
MDLCHRNLGPRYGCKKIATTMKIKPFRHPAVKSNCINFEENNCQ